MKRKERISREHAAILDSAEGSALVRAIADRDSTEFTINVTEYAPRMAENRAVGQFATAFNAAYTGQAYIDAPTTSALLSAGHSSPSYRRVRKASVA